MNFPRKARRNSVLRNSVLRNSALQAAVLLGGLWGAFDASFSPGCSFIRGHIDGKDKPLAVAADAA